MTVDTLHLHRTSPRRRETADGRYEVVTRVDETGYRTYRFRVTGERAYGEVCYLLEARAAIANHIAYGSWNAPRP